MRVAEQRLRAVWEVLDGASVTEVARRFQVSRQSVHVWLRRYAADQGLGDRSPRPHGCPHQMSPVTEAKIVEVRRAHPGWGADRIGYQLTRDGIGSVPGRTSIYRALLRNGLVVPGQRKRRRADYRRWERARPMELWQMDVLGGFHLADGTALKAVSGIDDSSYRVPIVLAGEPVEAVATDHLVRIFHREVLVAEHVQRRKPDTGQQQEALRQGSRRPRRPTDGPAVTRVVDSSGYVSFAGTNYRVGNAWRRRSAQVCVVADSVQLSIDGQIVRVHPIRHDRAKSMAHPPHGASATPNGRPRHRQDAPYGVGVKATPLRGRPTGRALTPTP